MKNIITAFFLISSLMGYAQEPIQPSTVHGLQVVALASSNAGFNSTKTVTIPKDQLAQFLSLSDRILWIKQQVDTQNIAGVVTRDGITFQLVEKFHITASTRYTTTRISKVPVFAFGNPVKPYKVVKQMKLEPELMALSLVQIADYYEEEGVGMTYDALLLLNNEVHFIQFN